MAAPCSKECDMTTAFEWPDAEAQLEVELARDGHPRAARQPRHSIGMRKFDMKLELLSW